MSNIRRFLAAVLSDYALVSLGPIAGTGLLLHKVEQLVSSICTDEHSAVDSHILAKANH